MSEDNVNQLTKADYESAIAVQSACNLSGVVYSFARVMDKICRESDKGKHGTDWKNTHAICRLYAEQIYHLTSKKDYSEAYNECEQFK
jgi:hypothetical protein